MTWLTSMIWLWIFGLTPVILSLVCGFYWLKNERFPWEKAHSPDEKTKDQGKVAK